MISIETEYKFRVFFSVDLVGSTAFKFRTSLEENIDDSKHPWLAVFSNFYSDFPVLFRQYYEIIYTNMKSDGTEIVSWKAVGDELLFYADITKKYQIVELMRAFIQTINEYKKILKDKKLNLSLKGTAWTAGFPIINSEVYVGEDLDFIGPSIDTGFRLTKFSTTSRLYISVELAYILSLEAKHIEYNFPIIKNLYYDGEECLKGVLNNKPYPKIFIYVEEDILTQIYYDCIAKINRTLPIPTSTIIELVDNYIKFIDMELTLIIPFICNDAELNKIPSKIRQIFERRYSPEDLYHYDSEINKENEEDNIKEVEIPFPVMSHEA